MIQRLREISVLLVDDHRIVRDGMKSYLNMGKESYKIFEAGNAQDAIHMLSEVDIDVVVMDINLPDISGIEATRQILELHPKTKVLGLSMNIGRPYVTGLLKAGAKGFLTKMCSAKELSHAILRVHMGNTYLCEEVMDIVRETVLSPTQEAVTKKDLTRRESQILKLIADGKKNHEIAFILNISIRTAEKHRKNLTDKLGVNSIAELTKLAIKLGIASIE